MATTTRAGSDPGPALPYTFPWSHRRSLFHLARVMLRVLLAILTLVCPVFADDLETQVKRLIDAFALVESNAADPVSSEHVFYQGVIPGMLRRLDPHSVFFDPDQFEQLKRLETSTSKGFGSVVSVLPGRVIVLQTIEGTPSAKSTQTCRCSRSATWTR